MDEKRINLALQGGGAHGAFSWGVLDRLLDEDWLTISAVSQQVATIETQLGVKLFRREKQRLVLTLDGDRATARGTLTVDRRDFGVGAGYADESTVGFGVAIRFDLTASRQP